MAGIYLEDSATAHGSLSQPCHVRIQGEILPVLYAGDPRNNPDGTFYPGDSFYYLIWFSASPTCVGMRVSPLGSTDGLDVGDLEGSYVDPDSLEWFKQKAAEKCQRTTKYSGCVSGRAIVNNNAPGSCPSGPGSSLEPRTCITTTQNIEQTVTGLKRVCYVDSSGKIICYIVHIVRTITLVPEIVNAGVNLVMIEEILTDTDGYETRNLDGTYYVWDPITIHHIPHMKWKNQRNNTIHFEIQRHSDLNLERNVDCRGLCDVTLRHPGLADSDWSLDNGAGVAIFNATDYSYLGVQPTTYDVTVHNAGLAITKDQNMVNPLIVRYDPVYDQYPYSLLSDDRRTAYENRAAVALHYFGSVGGGPDDTEQLHEDRRSKMNGFLYAGFGLDPWLPVLFRDIMEWSEASPISLEAQHRNVQESRHRHAAITENTDVVPCHTDPDTAIMVRAGYCRIYFDYPILDTVVGPSGPRYENATLFNTILSVDFGGRDVSFLSHYEYRFPESYLNTNLRVASLGHNGTIHPIQLHVYVSGVADDQTRPLSEYLYEKTFYDTGDPGIANITSGDIYPEEYSESGTGELEVKLRRITAKFETYQSDRDQNLAGLEIEDLAPLYFVNSRSARLDVPMDVGLGSLSPIIVNVTAGDATRQYAYDYVDFGAKSEILLNIAQDNTLEITRHTGSITITPDPGFGQITRLYIDDMPIDVRCGRTCTLSSSDNSGAYVMAENSWGGRASGILPEFIPEEPPGVRAFDPVPLALFALSLPPIYWMYRRLKG